ncbi:hypothetical protein ACKFKG_27340 [Phormidesmis sp. 146-35]
MPQLLAGRYRVVEVKAPGKTYLSQECQVFDGTGAHFSSQENQQMVATPKQILSVPQRVY